jgi:hypothetical protein
MKALTGRYRAEHLFALEHALASTMLSTKVSANEATIEAALKALGIRPAAGALRGLRFSVKSWD